MAPVKFIGISTWEFLDNDVDEILLRALCMDITGRVISARNFYNETQPRKSRAEVELSLLVLAFTKRGNV